MNVPRCLNYKMRSLKMIKEIILPALLTMDKTTACSLRASCNLRDHNESCKAHSSVSPRKIPQFAICWDWKWNMLLSSAENTPVIHFLKQFIINCKIQFQIANNSYKWLMWRKTFNFSQIKILSLFWNRVLRRCLYELTCKENF